MTTRKYPDLELITDKHKLPWQLALARGEQLAWHPASRCAAITPNVRVDQAPGQTLLAVDGEIYPATFRLASLLSEHQQFSQQDMAKLSTEETTLVDQLVDQGSLQIIDGTKE
ncbi:MAG: hypothetical protein DRR06_13200 [Gammaproteobacteria bacterium]|nr:MAG: hypothetical protein DRR06_13200 [Gammaproteobacteria bacterium]